MIITKTPCRISLFGGGSDYQNFFHKYGGAVIGGAIDKFSCTTVRYLPPFFDYKTRLVYSTIEKVNTFDQIQHKAIKACLEEVGFDDNYDDGLEIIHSADLPSRTGIGSSSTFIVSLLQGLFRLKGDYIDPIRLAKAAMHVEQDILQETVGCQDQLWASIGGLNLIKFKKNDEIDIWPLKLSADQVADLENHLLLFFTGFTRTASDIAKSYASGLGNNKFQLEILKLTDKAHSAILSGSHEKLGKLIDTSWQNKRALSPSVSNEIIDRIYTTGIEAGAFGGKLLGSGGGGFMMFVVPPENKERVRISLKDYLEIDFRFEMNGSRIIMDHHV